MEFLKIGKIFASTYYSVPDYQRDYEWTNSENSTLLDDIINMMMAEKNAPNHFMGAIVTIPFDQSNATTISIDLEEYGIETSSVKHIVDNGQQRLTSFSILLKSIYDLIKNEIALSEEQKKQLLNTLERFLIGAESNEALKHAPMLILNGNSGKCYNSKLLNCPYPSLDNRLKGARHINSAYNLFKTEIPKKIEENKGDNGLFSMYTKLIKTIINKIDFVEIECKESANAFQVFDSLNGKGLDLTAADRIKNVFCSWSPAGKGAQKWEALVADVEKNNPKELMTSFFVSLLFYDCGKRIDKNNLHEKFKSTYKDAAKEDFNYFYNELCESAKIYGNLRNAKAPKNASQEEHINEILEDFRSLNVDQVFVILFSVVKHYKIQDINKNKEFKEFAKSLQNLIVRMQVCEKSYNKLDKLFAECINLMKTSGSITSIKNKIIAEIDSSTPDDLFKKEFIKFCPKENRLSEFYCRHIENKMRQKNNNRTKVERGLTVEHIIPQTIDDLKEWYGNTKIPPEIEEDFNASIVENIGNKALLFGDDNSSAGNETYTNKLIVYENGKRDQTQGTPVDTFEMIKEVVNDFKDKFLHDEVKTRAEKLAGYAVEIW